MLTTTSRESCSQGRVEYIWIVAIRPIHGKAQPEAKSLSVAARAPEGIETEGIVRAKPVWVPEAQPELGMIRIAEPVAVVIARRNLAGKHDVCRIVVIEVCLSGHALHNVEQSRDPRRASGVTSAHPRACGAACSPASYPFGVVRSSARGLSPLRNGSWLSGARRAGGSVGWGFATPNESTKASTIC